jgi:hypothetical protein
MTAIPTLCLSFFKVIANAFSILCVFFGFYICILYVHNLPFISIVQYRSDIRVLDRTQASLLRSDAFEHVFAGYTTTEGALISTENVEKYVACVWCVARRRSKPERIEFCGWTW